MLYANRGYRTGVFVDNVNLFLACKKKFGRIPNHQLILKAALDDNLLHRAIAYGVHLNAGAERWAKALKNFGYETRTKPVCEGKADWDTEIVTDIWAMEPQLNMIVIVSGDGDFTCVPKRCKELRKPCRVIGVEGETSAPLIAAARPIARSDRAGACQAPGRPGTAA